MKREILFRGKSIDSDEWIEGYYVGDNTIVKKEDMRYNLGYIDDSCCYECHSESIEQYTGLKDKNNKDIYEDDIVTKYNESFVCKWIEKFACFAFIENVEYGEYNYFQECDKDELEIVGNVFDNPELLKS